MKIVFKDTIPHYCSIDCKVVSMTIDCASSQYGNSRELGCEKLFKTIKQLFYKDPNL